jgi:hypothetical protein
MPEIGTSGSMSGDGKRSVGHRPQATAPILDSTGPAVRRSAAMRLLSEEKQSLTRSDQLEVDPKSPGTRQGTI